MEFFLKQGKIKLFFLAKSMTGKCNPSPLLLVHFQQLASIHQFHDSRTKHYPLKGRGESAEAVGGGGCEFLVDFLSREGVISFTLSFH